MTLAQGNTIYKIYLPLLFPHVFILKYQETTTNRRWLGGDRMEDFLSIGEDRIKIYWRYDTDPGVVKKFVFIDFRRPLTTWQQMILKPPQKMLFVVL